MDENQFWKIIESSVETNRPYRHLSEELGKLSREDILLFHYIFTKKLSEACTFPLLAANFVISSYVSDDGFKEFRSWLVGQGRNRFENAVANPETITDWLDKRDIDEIDGNTLLSVAHDVYEELYEYDFLDKVKFEREPELVQDWPSSKADYRNKWRRLVDKFWNQERIREMHS